MKIVEADKRDLAEWRGMRSELYEGLDDGFDQKEAELILESDDKACFLALGDDGEPMGFVELSLRNIVDGCLTSPVGFIEGIYVKPRYRRSGTGSELFAFAARWFEERGCTEMATDAELSNTDGHRFHKRMGFEETYRIVEFRKRLNDRS